MVVRMLAMGKRCPRTTMTRKWSFPWVPSQVARELLLVEVPKLPSTEERSMGPQDLTFLCNMVA
jgi:hypothetical protein